VRAASPQRVVSPHARSQRTFSMSPMFRSSLVDIWADVDSTLLPRLAASADVSANIGRTSLPYASVDSHRPGSAAVGPRLLEPATSVFAGAPTVAAAHPGSLDVASSRTHVRSDTPMPSSDVGQRMRVDVPRPLDLTLPTVGDDVVQLYAPWSTANDDVPLGNVDVAVSAYDPASLTVLDFACAPSTSSVVAPRSTDASVHKPISAVGVRPPKSSVPIDVVEPSSGPAPPTRVDDMGQQRLGRPTSVDVASYPGLPSAGVDVVRQPHSSFLGADVVRPAPIRADVVYPSSMGADATRPKTLGGTHPPSLGAGVVGPMPTNVAYPSSVPIGSGIDVALRTSGPTLADPRSDIPRPRSVHASQYAAVVYC